MAETRGKAQRRRFTVDALFTDTSARGVGVEVLAEARLIRLERIEPDPNQPRRSFDDERLEELAASIRAEGVLQPIAVRYDSDRDVYVILHGERRWRAAHLAEQVAIPALVREVPEERRLIQQLMENVVREDLNALDRATALRALKEQMGNPSWEKVAEAVGIRRSRLFQLLDTEKLEDPLQEALRRGLVSEKQTRSLHRLDPSAQAEIGRRVLDGSLPARDLPVAARLAADAADHASVQTMLDDLAHAAPQAQRPAHSPVLALRRQASALARGLSTFDVRDFRALDDADQMALLDDLQSVRDHLETLLAEFNAAGE
ncbi:MAG: stage 0 sporulation protein J [Chloroflexi bacterium]|nr:MAG: stage 0 sporulation protein J [Chloroflexota bacterium]